MRTRTTTTGTYSTVYTRQQQNRSLCTAAFVNSGAPGITNGGRVEVKTIVDVNTPGFYRILKCGKFLPLNPVTIETIATTRTGASVPHDTTSGGCVKGRIQPGVEMTWLEKTPHAVVAPPFDESILAYLTNVAVADAKSAAWDALTAAAEFAKTAELVGRRANDLFSLGRKVAKRTKGRTARQRASNFASAWLEYRYGWMPIIYDVQDMIAAANAKLKDHNLVTGGSKTEVSLNLSDVRTYTISSVQSQLATETLTGTRVYRARAYAEVLYAQARTVGFDPIGTAWELTPFSFVVDWFIDVNSYLQAVSPFGGTNLLGCMNSVRDSYAWQQTVVNDFHGSDGSGSHSGTSGNISTLVEVNRYTRFPSSVSLPVWNPRLTPKRVVDLLALLIAGRSSVSRIISGR